MSSVLVVFGIFHFHFQSSKCLPRQLLRRLPGRPAIRGRGCSGAGITRRQRASTAAGSHRPATTPLTATLLRPALLSSSACALAFSACAAAPMRARGSSSTAGISPLRVRWCQYSNSPAFRGSIAAAAATVGAAAGGGDVRGGWPVVRGEACCGRVGPAYGWNERGCEYVNAADVDAARARVGDKETPALGDPCTLGSANVGVLRAWGDAVCELGGTGGTICAIGWLAAN